MASALAFDTLEYSKKLRKAGFTEEQVEIQAETIASLIDDKLATKKDLKRLENELKRDMKEMELRIKHDLTIRLGAMLTAGIAIVTALVKLL